MRQRKTHAHPEQTDKQPVRDGTAPASQFDEQGLAPESEHEYRGRESYEQQRDEGEGGRSGAWEHTDELERREPTSGAPPKQPAR
jgi:hypothetical protein